MFRPLALTALVLAPLPSAAQDRVAEMRLWGGWREDARHFAGIEIALAPGWKTYWRAPGDAGIPPTFDWTGSTNVRGVRLHWPVPHVFDQSGLRSIGYEGSVVLPIEVLLDDPSAPAELDLAIDMGVCKDICMPVRATARADLPAVDDTRDRRIGAALADRPLSAAEAGASALDCRFEATDAGLTLTAELTLPPMGRGEYAVIETADPGIWVSETTLRRDGGTLTARAELVPPRGAPLSIARDGLRLTILGGGGAVDIRGCG